MPQPSHVAIVLAGRGSRRLDGADKAMVQLDGTTLLDRVLEATLDAEQTVVVGPQRPTSHSVLWCEEKPVGGGPVAALVTGLAVAAPSDMVLVLASDLPFVAGAVAPLLDALTETVDVSVLVDADGRANYLASAWRRSALETGVHSLGDPAGLPMRRLLDGLRVAEVRDTGDWGFDCDTWEALDRARERGAKNRHD